MLSQSKIELKIKRNPDDFHASELCQPVKNLLLVPSQRILRAIGEGWIQMKYKGESIEEGNEKETTSGGQAADGNSKNSDDDEDDGSEYDGE